MPELMGVSFSREGGFRLGPLVNSAFRGPKSDHVCPCAPVVGSLWQWPDGTSMRWAPKCWAERGLHRPSIPRSASNEM
eukprot:596582-Alexandrium_andersonii.AAC.1